MLLAGALAFTSCSDDNESNPTLITPAAGSFMLNQPSVSGANVDLSKSSTITLNWSQPQFTNFNAPVVATYEVEVSTSGIFSQAYIDAEDADNSTADYYKLGNSYTSCTANINAEEIDKAIEILNGWDETSIPAISDLYFRVHAAVKNAGQVVCSEISSNAVKISAVPYYIELKAADPELWWLIGGDICDGSWGSDVGKCVIPFQTVEGFDYDKKTGQGEITWTGYLAGNGFKLRGDMNDGWATQWGQGDAFGSYVKNDGGSGNITVPAPGYYTITLNTATDALSVTAYEGTPSSFTSMCISGDFNDWGDTAMTPCFTFGDAVNHDWYIDNVVIAPSQKIKFKESGSWDYNTGGPISYTNGGDIYGYGTNGGPDIVPEPGTYMIIYNDITRYYRFIKK